VMPYTEKEPGLRWVGPGRAAGVRRRDMCREGHTPRQFEQDVSVLDRILARRRAILSEATKPS
jgi:hypothetical protein